MLVLLQQHRAHQTGDRGVIGEDADDAGSVLDQVVRRAHLSVRR